MNFVNFGIDLGTTNSLIAKFENGEVQIFKNPLGHKETLPSVVAFRGDRILVGDKAKEYIVKDAANVFGSFKRKMGTGENFAVPSTARTVTPVQLSAMVLKELKNFVFTGEPVEGVVITIPASFDTVQSNATKKAGYEAGFNEVWLLQEPIAASLAYFNESGKDLPEGGAWLVYDLGGGTFDVALITIANNELKVADHEGNNFLGGVDFDRLLLEQLILPKITEITGNTALEEASRTGTGEAEKLFYILEHKAEEAKKELSVGEETEIELTVPGSGNEIYIRLTRAEFNRIIHDKIAETVVLIKKILKRAALTEQDISQIIMVGGSTYIPYVRDVLAAQTGIPLAFDADPTTAVAVGAAYYAGSKLRGKATPQTETAVSLKENDNHTGRKLKAVFQAVSSEEEELYMAMPEGDFDNVFFRITRSDGGYDSGIKKVEKRISEFLPLQKASLNHFTIRFFDEQNNPVAVDHPPIAIMQGKFNVAGQPLPNDICLEVDDREGESTKLQVLFSRNDILPLKKTVYKEITRTLTKGSGDELVINVLEGTRHSRPHSNLVIGVIEIKGTDLKSDLLRGSDIELKFEISESRDLTITAYLAMTDQEFKNVFSPSEKYISVARLKDDVGSLVREMREELRGERARDEEAEWTAELRQCLMEGEKLLQRVSNMRDNRISDEKYGINEARRRISVRYDALGEEQRVYMLQADYLAVKNFIEEQLPYVDIDREVLASEYDRIVQEEKSFLREKSITILRSKIDALNKLRLRIFANTRHYITSIFLDLCRIPVEHYLKPAVATTLMKQGEEAMAAEQFEALRSTTIALSHQLKDEDGEVQKIKLKGTGIG